jgi:WD40 repeat protein
VERRRRPGNQVLSGHPDDVYSVSFSPDGKQLAVAASDNKAYIFNVP